MLKPLSGMLLLLVWLAPTARADDEAVGAPDPWLRDPRAAMTMALEEGKDLLFLFTSTDGEGAAYSLETTILKDAGLLTELAKTYVLVFLDHPKKPENQTDKEALLLTRQLMAVFALSDTPGVVLTTGEGHPYGRLGYEVGQDLASFRKRVQDAHKRAEPVRTLIGLGSKADANNFVHAFRALTVESTRPLFFAYPVYKDWTTRAKAVDVDGKLGLRRWAEQIEEEASIDIPLRQGDVIAAAWALIASKHVTGSKLLQAAYRFAGHLLKHDRPQLARDITAKALKDASIDRKDDEIQDRRLRQLKEALSNLHSEAVKRLGATASK